MSESEYSVQEYVFATMQCHDAKVKSLGKCSFVDRNLQNSHIGKL